jgi:hypothetical protein
MNVSLVCSGGVALSLEMVVVGCFSTSGLDDMVSEFGGKLSMDVLCSSDSSRPPEMLQQHNLSKSRLASSPTAA